MWLSSVRNIRCWPQRELLLLAGFPWEKGSMELGYTPESLHKWTTLAHFNSTTDWLAWGEESGSSLFEEHNCEVSISKVWLNDPRGGGCDTGSSCDLSTLQWIFYSQPIGTFPLLEFLVNTGGRNFTGTLPRTSRTSCLLWETLHNFLFQSVAAKCICEMVNSTVELWYL